MFIFTVHAEAAESTVGGVYEATYLIEKQVVQLVQGRAETQAAPGSASRVTTAVFGKVVYGDLDADGHDDAALFLVHDPGGSGTFYYVAAAIVKKGSYRGTNAVLLGDRVAPQSIQIRNGVIVAAYNDRRSDQPMAAVPTIDKTIYLTLKEEHLRTIKP